MLDDGAGMEYLWGPRVVVGLICKVTLKWTNCEV